MYSDRVLTRKLEALARDMQDPITAPDEDEVTRLYRHVGMLTELVAKLVAVVENVTPL